MDRRDFLKSTGSAAAAAGAGAAAVAAEARQSPASAARPQAAHIGSGTRDLTFAVSAPDTGRGIGESARRLARRIEALTGNAYRIHIASGDAKAGADMWHGSANDDVSHHASFSYFAGLPGRHGVAAADLDAWIALGGGQDLWDELASPRGFKPLLAGHSGAGPWLWSRAALADRSSLQGVRFAAEGLTLDIARALGAQPVAAAPGAIAALLASGRTDAAESPGAMVSLAADIPFEAPHALARGINRHGSAQTVSVKTGVWEKLPETHQLAIAMAAAEEFRLCVAEARVHEHVARRVIMERHKVAVVSSRLALHDAMDRVTDAVIAHVAGADRQAQRINASFMAFKSMLPPAGPAEAAALLS